MRAPADTNVPAGALFFAQEKGIWRFTANIITEPLNQTLATFGKSLGSILQFKNMKYTRIPLFFKHCLVSKSFSGCGCRLKQRFLKRIHRKERRNYMRFIRNILIQSVVMIVVMYEVQIIKYWIVGKARLTILGVILRLIWGHLFSKLIVKNLINNLY